MKNIYNKQRLVLIISGVFFASVAVFTWFYWQFCIDGGSCQYKLVDHWLRPLYYASLSLLGFTIFFLFLPMRYFWRWLIFIFSWGFPLSTVLVIERLGPLTGPLPIFARETIIILSVLFGILTLIFCGAMFWYEQKTGKLNKQ